MLLTSVFTLLILAPVQQPIAMGVCQALHNLSSLDGKDVAIRGVWMIGHGGQVLTSDDACDPPIVRDGWLWRDTIEVVADRRVTIKGYVAEHRRLQKKEGGDVKVVTTLIGVIETREHFAVLRYPSGFEMPGGFRYSVAQLRLRQAKEYVVFPYQPGELERELERERRPWPIRVR